jgi:hypothetical protein
MNQDQDTEIFGFLNLSHLVGCGPGRPKMLGGEAPKRKMYDLPANGIRVA